MSDLREQLANRLFEVVWKARHRQIDPGTPYSEAQFTEYKDLADECIRQMRWARHSYRWANPDGMEWDNGMDPTEDVSLAPDYWDVSWEYDPEDVRKHRTAAPDDWSPPK